MGILISFQINKYSKTLSRGLLTPKNRGARQSSSGMWAVSEMLCVLFTAVKKDACAPCVVCKYVKPVLNGGWATGQGGVCVLVGVSVHRGDSWVLSQALGL